MKGSHVLLWKFNKYVIIKIPLFIWSINALLGTRLCHSVNLGISNTLELKFRMDKRLNLKDTETGNIRIITLREFILYFSIYFRFRIGLLMKLHHRAPNFIRSISKQK